MTTRFKRKTLLILISFYIIFLFTLTALNFFGADRWWFGALNLYLPQAIWAAPAIPLLIISVMIARRWIWAPLLCIIWVLGPIMGFCWPLHSSLKPPGTVSLRVMTCNAKYSLHDISALFGDIVRYSPDLVLLQDAGGLLDSSAGEFFRKWNVRAVDQYVIASRFPLGNAEVRWISVPGEKQSCLRCQLMLERSKIILYNVHFQTPREGLNAFRTARKEPWYLPEAIKRLKNNVESRLIQAQEIGNLVIQEQDPVIVAGDLNSPDASQACATLRNLGLHDAFAEGGKGYGYTYGHFLLQNRLPWLHSSWMRIDHIMLNPQLHSLHCWTGTGKASDHRPVIADLILTRP
jgi:vancomycin resistance protein VanJ